MKYRYKPGFLDRFQPNVVRGRAIADGDMVEVVGSVGDPLKKFVYVEDEKGNRQSVYVTALVRP